MNSKSHLITCCLSFMPQLTCGVTGFVIKPLIREGLGYFFPHFPFPRHFLERCFLSHHIKKLINNCFTSNPQRSCIQWNAEEVLVKGQTDCPYLIILRLTNTSSSKVCWLKDLWPYVQTLPILEFPNHVPGNLHVQYLCWQWCLLMDCLMDTSSAELSTEPS